MNKYAVRICWFGEKKETKLFAIVPEELVIKYRTMARFYIADGDEWVEAELWSEPDSRAAYYEQYHNSAGNLFY
jgi:hypothetical protein